MNTRSIITCLALGVSITAASASYAATVKNTGSVCWTGEIEYITTTKKDMAWVYKVDWTFMADDKDPKKGTSGKCFGSGGLVNGKPDIATEFCIHNSVSGGSMMSHGKSGPKAGKGTFYGGIKASAGSVGGFISGARIQLPADKGRIAGCRSSKVEYTQE
jgi:hypothetical protein